jgi:hypothetical protein
VADVLLGTRDRELGTVGQLRTPVLPARYSTYGWHPPSVHVGVANARYVMRHEKRVLADVAKMRECFRTRLPTMEIRRPATLRIRGLAEDT